MNAYQKRQQAQTAAAVVGVDAGKFKHALVVRPRGGEDSKAFVFETTREGFEGAVERIRAAADGAAAAEILVGIEFAGVYGFTLAHYLHQQGFRVVSVLAAHTKKWKEVTHGQALKTDPKDAQTITDLVSQGQYVAFPFLKTAYAELRYLVSARDRLSLLRNGAINRLRSALQTVFPEFERIFKAVDKPTAMAILNAFPGPGDLLAAPRRRVLKILREVSRGHLREETYDALVRAARHSVALPGEQKALKGEIRLQLAQIAFYQEQMKVLEQHMAEAMRDLPEAECLMTIPGVAPVSAAIFLGLIGDPQAYESSRQVLRLAGLALVESSSGLHRGQPRVSKRGRPLLRKQAFMLALRSVRRDGIFREQFEAMLERNGGKRKKAVVSLSRYMLRLMFSVAKERRHYTAEAPNVIPHGSCGGATTVE
jgi:transposase